MPKTCPLKVPSGVQVHSTLLQQTVEQHEARGAQLEAAAAAAQEQLREATALHEALLMEYDEEMQNQTDIWTTRHAKVLGCARQAAAHLFGSLVSAEHRSSSEAMMELLSQTRSCFLNSRAETSSGCRQRHGLIRTGRSWVPSWPWPRWTASACVQSGRRRSTGLLQSPLTSLPARCLFILPVHFACG